MPKILDLRFLSQDIIENKIVKEDETEIEKSFIMNRIDTTEHEIVLNSSDSLSYNVEGNMKILDLTDVNYIVINEDITLQDAYTIIVYSNSNTTNLFSQARDDSEESDENGYYINVLTKTKEGNYLYYNLQTKTEFPLDGSQTEGVDSNKEIAQTIYGLSTGSNDLNLKELGKDMDKNIYTIQIFNGVLGLEQIKKIYQQIKEELKFNKEQEDLELSSTKLKLLIEYNETTKEIEKLTRNKDDVLKKANRHEIILKGRELVKQRVEFNKKWIHYLMVISKIVHVLLIVIVLVMIVYKVY